LIFVFIAATVIGTVSHELGHYYIAKHYGYNAEINYAYTYWEPANQDIVTSSKDNFCIVLGGPVETMTVGTIGLCLLLIFRKSFVLRNRLTATQWAIIFFSLFWLRQTTNLITWLCSYIITGHYSTIGDEIQIANYLKLPYWTILTFTGIIGGIILAVIIFKFIPKKLRLTFILAGLIGGIAGYVLWLILLGKYIMP
jgi:hypothetical protein